MPRKLIILGMVVAGVLLLVTALVGVGALCAQTPRPAQYKEKGFFAGGHELAGALLTGIRFGEHRDFLRVVLDLGVERNGKSVGAPRHPPYRIEYLRYPYRFRLTFEGVKYASDARVETAHALPLTVVTTADDTIKVIELFINKPAFFKVIEIDDPAKLSLDIKERTEEEIPRVYAVQLQGVDDVESAFNLIEDSAFPEDYQPDVLVLGNTVFVEAVYFTIDKAAEVAGKLEKAGFSTLVSERQGNELPRH